MYRCSLSARLNTTPPNTPNYRYTYRLLWLGGLLLWLSSILSGLSGCGGEFGPIGPGLPPSSGATPSTTLQLRAPTSEQQEAFTAAEALRQQVRLTEAFDAFKTFVRRYPSSPLTDKALLTLGDLSLTWNQAVQAEGYYRSLIKNFPQSPHLAEAQLTLGVLAYQRQDYDRSVVSLHRALPSLTSPDQLVKAHYYLGAIARQQSRYRDAIDAFKTAMDTQPHSETGLNQQAQSAIVAMIQDDLTLADLQPLSQHYLDAFPGGLILFRLAELYRDDKNTIDELATLQRLTTAFPDHPNTALAQARLWTLRSALTTDPAKIGVLLPLTGDARLAGQRALWGIDLALSNLRERDPSVNLVLVTRDTRGDPVVASNALRSLVNDEHVIGVIGPLLSQVATDIVPLIDELGIPTISPYARDSTFPTLSPYAFRNSLTDASQARFLAEYAIQVLKLERFAILYPDDAYGSTLKDIFIEHVVRLQGDVVTVASYPHNSTNFRQAIELIGGVNDQIMDDLRSGADTATIELPPDIERQARDIATPLKPYDAVFLPGYYDSVGLIAPELAFYNITDVQLLGTDGWNSAELTVIGESFVEKAIFVDGFFAASSAPLVRSFVKQFQVRYGEPPTLLSAQGYDTLQMIGQILQSGITTRDELRNRLLLVQDFPGISGLTTFNPEGDTDKVPYLLTVKKGQIVQLN